MEYATPGDLNLAANDVGALPDAHFPAIWYCPCVTGPAMGMKKRVPFTWQKPG
jgi:hypothetical protein